MTLFRLIDVTKKVTVTLQMLKTADTTDRRDLQGYYYCKYKITTANCYVTFAIKEK